MLERLQDLYGYVVGRPSTLSLAADCPPEVDVAWLRWVVPDPGEANRSRWPTDPTWAVVQSVNFADAPAVAWRLIRRKVRSDRVEQRDRGSYGLLASRTALASPNPKYWNLDFAMAQIYKALEVESKKPGKAFEELVRRRRRELGLPVPSEERILPFRSQPSLSLSAIDIAIDHGLDDTEIHMNPSALTLSLLQKERRLEELDVAIEEATRKDVPERELRRLVRDYGHELRGYETLSARIEADD